MLGSALLLASLSGLAAATNLGGQGYVDLSVYGGIPSGLGAGILYGLPNDPAYSPQTAPSRNVWGSYFTGAGVNAVRAGGAQIPFPGYAVYVTKGDISGYRERFASTLRNYQDTMALNPNAIFVLLPHDLWGADGVTASTSVYPCDNGDCTTYRNFLNLLIGDLKSNGMTKNLHIDIWNEPDGS